jgi:hypothetical protein
MAFIRTYNMRSVIYLVHPHPHPSITIAVLRILKTILTSLTNSDSSADLCPTHALTVNFSINYNF